MRKPGAFARYRFREQMFPTMTFRLAYDALREWRGERADVEYVRILHLAATTMESTVDSALGLLLEAGGPFAGLYAFFESKAAWYDKPPPSFVNAIALVRRHLWLTSEGFSRSGVEPDTQKVQPLCTIHS